MENGICYIFVTESDLQGVVSLDFQLDNCLKKEKSFWKKRTYSRNYLGNKYERSN